MLKQQHKPINIIREIGEVIFSVLAQAFQVSIRGGRIGAVLGLIFGAVLWVFFKQNTNFGMLEGAIIGMAFIGLTGFIISGLIGIILGILTVYHNGKLYELYVYSMVWLGASPPPEYKALQADVIVEAGIGRLILQVCFWVGFWAIEGAILGAIGGVLFSLFVWESLGEAIFFLLLRTITWGIMGMIFGIIIGPYMWLSSQVMKKIKVDSFTVTPPSLIGDKIGERLFNKLFGDNLT